MDRFTGGCLCGNVRIVASGLPYRVGLCHCLDCRKHHGALFHASAVFPQDAVTIDGETRDYAGRFFCPRCGSSLFARTADYTPSPKLLFKATCGVTIAVVSFRERKRRQPGLATDGPEFVGWPQLVRGIQGS